MFIRIAILCLLTISISTNAQKLLVYKDACDDNRFGWAIFKSDAPKDSLLYYIENGAFVVNNKYHKGSSFRWVQRSFGANNTANTSIQADVTQLEGDQNRGYGIVYNTKDGSNYVQFVISGNGYYNIAALKDGKINGAASSWVKSSLVKTGLNIVNRLKVEQRGDSHTFYLNDVMVKKVDFVGQPFLASIGLMIAGSMRCSIDNLEVYQWLPEAELSGKVGPGFVSTLTTPVAAKPYPTKTSKPEEYFIQVNKKNQYGLRDKDGYRLLDPLFTYVFSSDIDGSIFIDKTEGEMSRGIFSPQLLPITPMILSSNIGVNYKFTKEGYMSCKMPNGFWGLIDKTGNTVLPFVYDQLDDVSEGILFAQKSGQWGAIDLKGETVFKFGLIDDAFGISIYSREKKAFRNGLVIARAKPGDGAGDGLMNKKGEWVVLPKYYSIQYKEESKVYITELEDHDNDKRYLFGLIDETGKPIPLPTYNAMYVYGQNYVVGKGDCDDFGLSKNGSNTVPCKWGLIDKTGKVLIPLNFHNVFSTSNKEIFQVELLEKGDGTSSPKTKIGFYNTKGKEIIPIQYDYVAYDSTRKNWFKDLTRTFLTTISDDCIINVCKDGKFGAIDITGKILVPLQYDFVSSFVNGLAFVKKGAETFYIDKTGKKFTTPTNTAGRYSPLTELPPIRK